MGRSLDVHPRVCVSGISSWKQPVADDLALYEALGVHTVGAALRKLDADEDVDLLARSGINVTNMISVGTDALERSIDLARRLDSPRVVFTTGRSDARDWDAAAHALTRRLADVDRAGVTLCLEHTHSLRTDVSFVHTLRDAVDLAERLDIAVCMEINACWAERDLGRTVAGGAHRIGLVQVIDYAVGT